MPWRCRLRFVCALLLALIFASPLPVRAEAEGPLITVVRSASCECCRQWERHLEAAGFRINDQISDSIDPTQAYCHTASVAGYRIDGHVPAASVQRLLAERPDVRGLAVPGMPIGSPGMEVKGRTADPFAVMAIAHDGSTTVFERY
jgi:hypothetical protein